jgi:predicted RNA-binding protein with PIN domain
MRWLIDGYNVIRRDPDLRGHESESLEAGRTALLRLLARAHRDARDEFTVVFDGARVQGGAPSAGRIRVIFSRPPGTADDELIRLGRQHGAGAVIVTSDRKVQDAARRAGCPVLTAEEFLRGLSADSEPHRIYGSPATKDEGNDRPREKRGNPRRLSKRARATARALRRLRRP